MIIIQYIEMFKWNEVESGIFASKDYNFEIGKHAMKIKFALLLPYVDGNRFY